MCAMSKASKFCIAKYISRICRVLDSNFDGVPKRSLMRNGEKMYSEFEWRTLMDKNCNNLAQCRKSGSIAI